MAKDYSTPKYVAPNMVFRVHIGYCEGNAKNILYGYFDTHRIFVPQHRPLEDPAQKTGTLYSEQERHEIATKMALDLHCEEVSEVVLGSGVNEHRAYYTYKGKPVVFVQVQPENDERYTRMGTPVPPVPVPIKPDLLGSPKELLKHKPTNKPSDNHSSNNNSNN